MRALVIANTITRRDSKSIEKYLNEIGKFEVLSPEEEQKLFRRLKEGDEEAFERIINCNLRFVVSVAKQYPNCGLSLNDLINEGNLGLIKAARRFDETKGFKFISYAVWWIRQTIIQAISEKARSIRVPLNQQSTSMKIQKQSDKMMQSLEREPTLKEISEEIGLNEDDIAKSLQSTTFCRSLDEPVNDGEEATLYNFLIDWVSPEPDAKLVNDESLQVEVAELLDTLSGREKEVVSMFFGIGHKRAISLQDIGELIGVSRERARQIKDRSLRKLRSKVARQKLIFSTI